MKMTDKNIMTVDVDVVATYNRMYQEIMDMKDIVGKLARRIESIEERIAI